MSLKLATNALHAGHDVTQTQGTRAVPIYQTSSYVFNDSDHAANLFALAESGYIYTRLNNPTNDILEQRLAAVEGGVAAVATASGTAAIATTFMTLLKAGDHIVASNSLYGGTYNMLNNTLPRFGITTTFVDPDKLENFAKAVQPNTRAFFAESLGNPKLDVLDLKGISAHAKAAKVPFIVDNTIATPALLNPIAHGANIVIHSLTQSLSYAKTTLNAITQETEQQEEAVAEETMAEEAPVMEEAAVEEEEAAPAEASFTQELKKRFIEGGPGFMGIVLICLILGLAIAIERIIYLNLATTNSQKLTAGVEEALSSGGVEAAKELCRNTKGPVASIFYQGLDRVNEGVESAEKAVVAYGGVQMGQLEKNVSWISLFIALAPMLGFMGTVIGMIQAFDKIEAAGDMQPSLVAGGIKVALLTTVFGLIVAIILQVFYNYIIAKIDSIVNDMEDASINLIDILVAQKK